MHQVPLLLPVHVANPVENVDDDEGNWEQLPATLVDPQENHMRLFVHFHASDGLAAVEIREEGDAGVGAAGCQVHFRLLAVVARHSGPLDPVEVEDVLLLDAGALGGREQVVVGHDAVGVNHALLPLGQLRHAAAHDGVLGHEGDELAFVVFSLEPADERVEEVDEGELDESGEDVDKAEDDKDVEGRSVSDLKKSDVFYNNVVSHWSHSGRSRRKSCVLKRTSILCILREMIYLEIRDTQARIYIWKHFYRRRRCCSN